MHCTMNIIFTKFKLTVLQFVTTDRSPLFLNRNNYGSFPVTGDSSIVNHNDHSSRHCLPQPDPPFGQAPSPASLLMIGSGYLWAQHLPVKLTLQCRPGYSSCLHQLWKWNRQCSETSTHKIQKPGNHPKERIQHSEHGESLKWRNYRLYTI
jgi:hypothetical protein